MARYILLRVEDDAEADRLLLDSANHSGEPLLTPVQENMVHAQIVPELVPPELHPWAGCPCDSRQKPSLQDHIRASYDRTAVLVAEYEAEA